jgi:glycosyltransferase involved in cell wall biosynthesis
MRAGRSLILLVRESKSRHSSVIVNHREIRIYLKLPESVGPCFFFWARTAITLMRGGRTQVSITWLPVEHALKETRGASDASGDGLRIAHVQPMSLDFYGHDDSDLGTRVRYSVSNLAVAQAAMGDSPVVHLLGSGDVRTLEFDGVRVRFHRCVQPPRRLDMKWRFSRQFSIGMLAALRRGSADIVHFHGARQLHGMFAAVAWRASRERLPLVAQERGSRRVGWLETQAQLCGLRRSRLVLAATEEGRSALIGLGVPAARLRLLPNGFDSQTFRPGEPTAPSPPLRVLTVSRFEEEKDPLTMAAGVIEFAKRGRSVELTVIGVGSLRPAVARALASERIPTHFIDQVPQVELRKHYLSADVFLLTSSGSEGWTQVIVEAMACGVPVISTDVAGPRDALAGSGLLVPVKDPSAVADALALLSNSTEQWWRMRQQGLKRSAGFTWDAVAHRLRAIYAEVLQESERSTIVR